MISLLWTVLGYAVFSLASVRYDGWRLSFYTAFGAGLTIALVLYTLSYSLGRARWFISMFFLILAVLLVIDHQSIGFVLLALVAALGFAARPPYNLALLLGAVLTIAMARQLDLHRWLTSVSLDVQELVTEVVLASPGVTAESPIVLVLDGREWGADLPINTSLLFDSALDLIYGDPSYFGHICALNVQDWGWHSENCSFTSAGIQLEYNGVATTYAYTSIILVSASPDGDVRLVDEIPAEWGAPVGITYDPWRLLNRDASPPSGLETWFGSRPLVDR